MVVHEKDESEIFLTDVAMGTLRYRESVLVGSKMRGIALLSVIFALPHNLTGQTVEPMKHCATTPTYKYFEQVQYDAYTSNPTFQQILAKLRDSQEVLKSLQETDKLLQNRDNPLGGRSWKSGETDEYIKHALKNLKLPTCYENPFTFFMLSEYAREIDEARRDLRLPLPSQVNLGTLPTTEVNAYTYPAAGDVGSVIALNTQLFMFAYQMTKVTVPTVSISNDEQSKSVAVDHSREQAIIAIASKADIQTNFTTALLEFLLLTPPSTEPLAQSYDSLVITFTEGMEKFAVAHEYGHVIKKHISPTMNVRLGAADDDGSSRARSVPVFARSWQQELEADQVGFQLLSDALRREAKADVSNDLRWVYTLKGALFFFKCLDIVEQAKIVRDTGKLPPPPSMTERVFVRAFAEGKSSAEQSEKYRYLTSTSHPPAWLRLERIQSMIQAELSANPPSSSALAFSDIADGILDNVQLLWLFVSPKLPIAVEAVRPHKGEKKELTDDELKQLKARADAASDAAVPVEFPPGCFVEADSWSSSFLCGPNLQEAASMFQNGSSDEAIIRQYEEALKADWLLLSGIQARWAESRLLDGRTESRQNALAIAALSGDRQSLDVINKLDTTSWSDEDRELLARSKRFLSNHGRNTSTSRLASVDPASLHLGDFLCFPTPLDSSTNVSKLIPTKTNPAAETFLNRNSSVRLGRSVSSMALAMVAEGKPLGDTYSVWADLLEEAGETDAALRFANAGIASGGSRAALENTIGNLLSAKHKLAAANEHYAASLAAGRIDGWPELNTAINLSDSGDLDGAERWFRLALSRRATVRSQTEWARYLNEFAWFLATKRSSDDSKLKEALTLSEESNRVVQRRNPNYLDTLAECEARTGDTDAAVKTAEEALNLVSNNPDEKGKYAERLAFFRAKVTK